jgi:hypothetical protein
MASYNHAPFIRIAVESVLNQTFADWELVITDDGSSDGTIEALDGIRDDRIRIERFPENRSACVALNHCIRRARGRYIAVLNSDDAWLPEKLALQLDAFAQHPEAAAIFTTADIIDERGRHLGDSNCLKAVFDQPNRPRRDWLKRLILSGNCLCHPSVLMRAEVYESLGLYDQRMAQLPDLDMWVRVLLEQELWVVQEPLTLFRVLDHERNASGNRLDVRMRCATENMLLHWKAFQSHPEEMAAVLGVHAVGQDEIVGSLLNTPHEQPLPRGFRAAELLWLYESMQDTADWRACKKFIAITSVADPLGVAATEQRDAKASCDSIRDVAVRRKFTFRNFLSFMRHASDVRPPTAEPRRM